MKKLLAVFFIAMSFFLGGMSYAAEKANLVELFVSAAQLNGAQSRGLKEALHFRDEADLMRLIFEAQQLGVARSYVLSQAVGASGDLPFYKGGGLLQWVRDLSIAQSRFLSELKELPASPQQRRSLVDFLYETSEVQARLIQEVGRQLGALQK